MADHPTSPAATSPAATSPAATSAAATSAAATSAAATPAAAPVTIKKYANRRLYNTATSSYVTLDHLCQMVKQGQEFNVYDAKTNQDITRSVLTQIIFEEENKGQHLLPIQFLRQLIGFYGDQMGAAVPRYLEVSMESFARNQEEIRGRMTKLGAQPFKIFEDMTRQNLALFQESWMEAYRRMMSFGTAAAAGGRDTARTAQATVQDTAAARDEAHAALDEVNRLREQVEAMQKRLDDIGTSASQTPEPTPVVVSEPIAEPLGGGTEAQIKILDRKILG